MVPFSVKPAAVVVTPSRVSALVMAAVAGATEVSADVLPIVNESVAAVSAIVANF